MNAEEDSLGTIEGDGDERHEYDECLARRIEMRHQKQGGKNKRTLGLFLGGGRRVHEAAIVPWYYGGLLTWALKRYMEKEGWQAVRTLGYELGEPVHTGVNTGCGQQENLLANGQLLIEKEASRLVVTVKIHPLGTNSVLVEGPANRRDEVRGFMAGVCTLAREQNFYRGEKLEFASRFAGRLRFLQLKDRSWESIILDENTKNEVWANTVGFLARKEWWPKHGISPKRGLLLAGEPGTGKTVICKALMAQASGVTCIAANAYALDEDEYLTDLYKLAEDLSPCIVFIEDIDLIGQNRYECGYQRGSALLSLMSVLDGIEEKKNIITVATTNCLDMLDRALSQRPSRFDRVVRLTKPSFDQRLEIVSRLCQRVPLTDNLQRYVAGRTDGFTPAQVQEVIYSLVIEQTDDDSAAHIFSEQEVDRIVSRINGKTRHPLGFHALSNHNGQKADFAGAAGVGLNG